jgi:hypothetical protein
VVQHYVSDALSDPNLIRLSPSRRCAPLKLQISSALTSNLMTGPPLHPRRMMPRLALIRARAMWALSFAQSCSSYRLDLPTV